jgi:hypothetical protein
MTASGPVETAVLLVRVANWRFLATLDPKGMATFETNDAKASAALDALDAIAGPDIKPLVAAVREDLGAYASSFG